MHRFLKLHALLVVLFGMSLLFGCGTNPANENDDQTLIPMAREIKIGSDLYVPTQQSQGGPYVADPRLNKEVMRVGMKLAKVSKQPTLPYEFVVLNNSTPDAWALPGGKIAITRGLLMRLHNEAELAAILSHMIVHGAMRHTVKSVDHDSLMKAGSSALAVTLGGNKYPNLIVGTAKMGTALIHHQYNVNEELKADTLGMKMMARAGYDPRAEVTLQEIFVKLAQNKNSNWFDGLFASHPPSQQRLNAIKQTAGQLPAKGDLGEANFQAAISHLIHSEPAYAKYQQGQQALSDRKYSAALTIAQQAIAMEPNEALFYALKGDALYYAEKFQDAEKAYNKALKHNPGFFYYYLQRGLTHYKLKQSSRAQKDLIESIQLLPTAIGLNNLGNLQSAAGEKNKAIASFRLAATSKSIAGQRATSSLARLELPIHPEKYFTLKPVVTQNGTVGITLTNNSPVTVNRVSVDVSIVTIYEAVLQKKTMQAINTIAPGESITLDSSLFLPGRATTDSVRTKITYAEAAPSNN